MEPLLAIPGIVCRIPLQFGRGDASRVDLYQNFFIAGNWFRGFNFAKRWCISVIQQLSGFHFFSFPFWMPLTIAAMLV
jgi:hypothetical protein